MFSKRQRAYGAILGIVLGCLALIGLDCARSWQDHDLALAAARNTASSLANSFAADLQGRMLATDVAVTGLAERLEIDGTSPAALSRLSRLLGERAGQIAMLEGIYAYDAAGAWLVPPSNGSPRPYSVADRDYFAALRDHKRRDMQIGLPIRSRATGRWIVPLTRRFDRPDGGFGGVVMAGLDIDLMQAFYAHLPVGADGAITVFRADGRMLMHYPPLDSRIGEALPDWQPFAGPLANQPEGIFESPSWVDGIDRLRGFRRLANYPLVVQVAMSRAEVLARWRSDAMLHLLGVLALAGLAACFGVLMLRAGRRRHAAELAAAEAGSKYRLLADHATDLIILARADGKRVYVSPSCETLLGYTQAEMLAAPTGNLTHPEDWRREGPRFQRTFDSTGSAMFTVRMRHRDGTYVWIEANTKALPRQPGLPAENMLVLRDISERHAVTERLEQANHMLERAEAIAHIGHWRLDAGTRDLVLSAEACRIHGWPVDTASTADAAIQAYHPEDRDDVAGVVQRALAAGKPYHFDKRIVRADGSIRYVNARGEPEYGEDGRLVAVVGTLQDITETRELEAELRHRQRLEAIGQIAAGVAHDFNNILQGVIGSIELILDDAAPGSDLRASAEVAYNAAYRGASLTGQLLSFARKQVLLPRPIDVASLFADMRDLCDRTLGKHIAVTISAPPGLPDLFADPQHLSTALLNLAINAAHAMPGGGQLRLEASVEGRIGDDGWVVIAVSDTGAGMDAETLKRATEPFFSTKGLSGTGLGLPMVLGFARQSGGDLRLFSAPGSGTRVELVLPGHAAGAATHAVAPVAPAKGTGRVLLVDDASDVLDIALRFLTRAGFEVSTAADGDAALALLARGERFDVMVTDYAMPGLSGVDLVVLAREIQPGLPAIVMTGFAEVDTSRIASIAEPLRKPFLRQNLIDAVTAVQAAPRQSRNGEALTPAR
jgi:PAS domain S-box-containing protein